MALPRIFLSHAYEDSAWCRDYYDEFKARGFDIWMDEIDVPFGTNLFLAIGEEIPKRDDFHVILTPAALASRWVPQEQSLAFSTGRRILPVRRGSTSVTGWATTMKWLDVGQKSGHEAALEVITKAYPEALKPDPVPPLPHFRRLPVYLLIDTSANMSGERAVAANEGVRLLYQSLMQDPQAIETVWISVITFSEQAHQFDLLPIDQFVPPVLGAFGNCFLEAALHVLVDSIEEDLNLNTQTSRGDYAPLVFLLTSGTPTNASGKPGTAYRTELQRLKALRGSKKPTIVALGCGTNVNEQMLQEITPNVFMMYNVTSDGLRQYFRWISGSISHGSHAARAETDANLAAPLIPNIVYRPLN